MSAPRLAAQTEKQVPVGCLPAVAREEVKTTVATAGSIFAHNSQRARRLPPFGAAVLTATKARKRTNTFIIATPDAWNDNACRVDRVVLPPNASPDDFDWSCFRGQEPVVIGGRSQLPRLRRLCWLLMQAGASVICLLWLEGEHVRAAILRHE